MLLGSFNGLVCLYGLEDYTACLCNPVTKEYVMLPTIKRDFDDDEYIHYLTGFGFLTTTHEYKVVEMYKLKTDLDVLLVGAYTVGSGNGWISVGRLDTKFIKVNEGVGVYVNETLHWMDKHRGTILVFDLIKEKFSEYLSPPPLSPYSTQYDCTLGDLGVVLYYAVESNFDIEEGPCFDVWLLNEKNDIRDMKEQARQEPLCWSKEFRLPQRRPLAFTKSGGLLCFTCASLGVYNALTGSSKKLVDFRLINQIFPHKNTLVSLKELGEEDTKIMGSAEVEDT
ncbi:uncharacterized protein LOC113331185 [Papaver somniferum]|uniref:uncharacterized protein LOC113331185 n=1 Tax=Papaver somniferum TaxID=3469 RepID=UPI000E6F6F89|nr:uncharacterized protein LOC113331185 [Papaver somniferum]XP_026433715.1 uncharacterized protein LOC113331185 [Papaver somniferum]